MNVQKLGGYLTWGGYAAGIVAIILAAHHVPIMIAAGAAVALVFVGRQLEKVKPT